MTTRPSQSLFEAFQATTTTSTTPPPPPPSIEAIDPAAYTKPFIDFISNNPTVYHAVNHFEHRLDSAGFSKLSERDTWDLKLGGKYYFNRNSSGLIAFKIGKGYKPGNGAVIIAAHIDALTAKVKPISSKPVKNGFQQVGVAQYGGALNQTWWDRDLSIGGRVFVKDSKGKIHEKLVRLDWPVARIPTIAPHFGLRAEGQSNQETRMVPIIGLDNSDLESKDYPLAGVNSFIAAHPPSLVKAIAGELSISDYSTIINWDLEMYDSQPAQLGGLNKEFIFAGRVDDKLCSFAALEALIADTSDTTSGTISIAGLFDDEEVGSKLRQGANSNFLPSTIERIIESFADKSSTSTNLLYQTYANSFMVSADVCHAYNPNYDDVYLKDHTPRLNVGVAVSFDSNAHMTTDGVSSTIFNRIAEKSGSQVQVFQIRNDSRSGGTVGPMLSSKTGIRAIDAGIPQLSMHSIRATTGSLDPGLGVKLFKGVYEHFHAVDQEFV
ncbi:MAG: hypothetical protein GOMPHAMPRED_000173 [Gomphillus americanus]|uniref:Aspartyl aminopeptidase n=1 Tax=Gomphillus americanus TaxID=1940652 RepID=A0A8H3EB77_9LECA|nr:MAG: hypothetical protein GOMPHAMPRED_000173 [Gomphillus americanus]